MKSLMKDESADSMIIFVIIVGALMFGLTYILLSNAFNPPIDIINGMIDKGQMSDDTIAHVTTMLDLWKCAPFFWIIGTILWCFERSKGESISSNAYFEYLVLMCITLVISVYLVWGFGSSVDAFCTAFESNMYFVNYGGEWDVSQTRNLCVCLMYYATMAPGFLGSLLFMLHPILKQRDNTFLDGTDENSGTGKPGEYITNYQLDQF
ncbi:MAG: hypothetical protein LLF94_11325 [Chlamydiales bacterium]|nr:hypothetical protein [Chlamydiales bacterium]